MIKQSPLLNFVMILVDVIKSQDFRAFKGLLNHYAKCLNRDTQFREYLEKICNLYFEG